VPLSQKAETRFPFVSCDRRRRRQPLPPPDLRRLEGWSPLSLRLPLRRQQRRGPRSSILVEILRLGLVFYGTLLGWWALLWANNSASTPSHTGVGLHGGVSELIPSHSCLSFRSVTWSPCFSWHLARYVSRRFSGIRRYPRRRWGSGRGGCSGARLFVRRWWIYRYSPTSSMRCSGCWSKIARDVPRSMCHGGMCHVACTKHVHRLIKSRWRWWPFGSRNSGGSASHVSWRRPLASASVENSRDSFFSKFSSHLFTHIMYVSFHIFSFTHVTWFSVNEMRGVAKKNVICALVMICNTPVLLRPTRSTARDDKGGDWWAKIHTSISEKNEEDKLKAWIFLIKLKDITLSAS
jgi:hypothetical protein